MLDRQEIARRFFECYPTKTRYALAKNFGVHLSITYKWHEGLAPVPWHRIKDLVDEQGISWDWIIDGKEPKYRQRQNNEKPHPLDRNAINQRFLLLFPNMSQAQIGKEIGVNPGTVYKWRHNISQVPWERLKYAVINKGVTWDWLIEGR